MHWKNIIINCVFQIIIMLVAVPWIKAQVEGSVQLEYNKKFEDYRNETTVRERAEKVAEYLALVKSLPDNDASEENKKLYREANRLSWELAMWIPEDIYKGMTHSIVHPDKQINAFSVIIEVRKLLLGEKAGDLSQEDIAGHAPGIGKHNIPIKDK